LVFWAENQQRIHHKVGTARLPKAIHTAIYAEGACPYMYTHRATRNHHTECAGLPSWPLGSRRARIAYIHVGSPRRFVPSLPYKRQKLRRFFKRSTVFELCRFISDVCYIAYRHRCEYG
jgi:hypothetical protein